MIVTSLTSFDLTPLATLFETEYQKFVSTVFDLSEIVHLPSEYYINYLTTIKLILFYHCFWYKVATHFSWNNDFLVLATLLSFYISFCIIARYSVFFNCLVKYDLNELFIKVDTSFAALQFILSWYLNANWNLDWTILINFSKPIDDLVHCSLLFNFFINRK
jgi:hypothetical protein